MSYVRVSTIIVPVDMRERFEEHYRGRIDQMSGTEGFEGFELLRPQAHTDPYMIYSRWRNGAAFDRWQSTQLYDRDHDGGGDALAPLAYENERTWSYEVIESTGPKPGTA